MKFPSRAGGAIIFSLAMLALLAVLGVAFVTLSNMERGAGRSFVDRTRARLAAESGIDAAIQYVSLMKPGVLPAATAKWLFGGEYGEFAPLEQWSAPSMQAAESGPGGWARSGGLGDSAGALSDAYRLRVEDASGKINLNGPDAPVDPNDPRSFGRLQSIVMHLVNHLFTDERREGEVESSLGFKLASRLLFERDRLGGRFSGMEDVARILIRRAGDDGGLLTEAQFDKLLRCVTLHSWEDPCVLRPSFRPRASAPPGEPEASWNEDGSLDLYLFSDMQTEWHVREPRSPVNVNTAAEAVLAALIAPVQGWVLEEGPAETLSGTGHYGLWNFSFLRNTAFVHGYYAGSDPAADPELLAAFGMTDPITRKAARPPDPDRIRSQMRLGTLRRTPPLQFAPALARLMFRRVHEGGNPFESWDEFRWFLEQEIPAEFFESAWPAEDEWIRRYHRQILIDALLANFNPNANLNDYNPDASHYRHVDKAQLCGYSTEFCFEPTGIWDIESLGVVLGPDGRALASCRMAAGVKLHDMLRLTTQADFLDGFEKPDDLGRYFSIGNGIMPTTGDWIVAGGFSLQSLPEPVLPDSGAASLSVFDGAIQLASWVPDHDGAQFHVDFETGFRPRVFGAMDTADQALATDDWLEEGDGDFVMMERLDSSGIRNRYWAPGNRPVAGRLTWSKADWEAAVEPRIGTLLPDGALSDAGRALAWRAANLGMYDPAREKKSFTGGLEFWIKPNFLPEISTRIRRLFAIAPRHQWLGPGSQHEFGLYYFANASWNNVTGEPRWRSFHPFFYGSQEGGRGFLSNRHDWIPARCLAFGYGYSRPELGFDPYRQMTGAQISESAVESFPGMPRTGTGYAFRGHAWNHLAVAWRTRDFSVPDIGGGDADWMRMTINGRAVSSSRYWSYREGNTWLGDMYRLPDSGEANWMRFGGSTTDWARNFVADSTYDDIAGHALGRTEEEMTRAFADGRYYDESDAVYASPPIDVRARLGLRRDQPVTVRSVSWTVTWPRRNRGAGGGEEWLRGAVVNVGDREDPMSMTWREAWDPVAIDVSVRENEWVFPRDDRFQATYCGGTEIPRRSLADFSPNVMKAADRLRFRVRFAHADGEILYESPRFEDITFAVETGRPGILYWRCR